MDSNDLTAVPSPWVTNRRFVIFEMSQANPKNLRSRMYGRSNIASKPVRLREDPPRSGLAKQEARPAERGLSKLRSNFVSKPTNLSYKTMNQIPLVILSKRSSSKDLLNKESISSGK